MQISRLNQSLNVNFEKKKYNENKVNSPISQGMTELANNSLAEAIGRSQVSFRGEIQFNGNLLEYQHFGKLTGKSENFIYNKEDGSIEYEEYTGNNVLIKRYYFNPAQGKEVITLLQDDGTTTVTTKEPDLYKFERLDEDGKPLYLEEANDDSEESKANRITVTYEYGDKEREIIRRYKNGEVSEIEVIDQRTGDVVTEGRLLESKFRAKDGSIITKNIVNGNIYERELTDSSGRRKQYEEYSRETLALIHEFKTDKKTGETFERKYTDDGENILFVENKSAHGNVLYKAEYSQNTFKKVSEEKYDVSTGSRTTTQFTEDGIKLKETVLLKDGTTEVSTYDENGNIKNLVITSKNKREVDEYQYSPDGEMISDIHLEFNRKGALQEKTEYIPDTGIIKTRTDYKNESSYTKYEYHTESNNERVNVPKESETYQSGEIISAQKYHKDGETIAQQIVFGDDKFFTISIFDEGANILEKTYCTDKGVRYGFEKYNDNGVVVKRVKIINSMNLRETTLYDYDGIKTKFIQMTEDGKKPLLKIEYYSDGKTKKVVREYNEDGSYTKTEYDEYEKVISITEHKGKAQQTTSSQATNGEPKKETSSKEDLISSIAKKIGKPWVEVWPEDKRAQNECFAIDAITPAEMKALLEVTGFETQEELFSMTKKQYRSCAMKFHPDRHGDDSPEDQNTTKLIFQILNDIYSNSPNEGV